MKQCAYYSEGKTNKITLVFSCPGKIEEDKKKPVAGQTGNNLDNLLNSLEDRFLKEVLDKTIFSKWKEFNEEHKRYFFRITNTTEKPLYYARDKKTEEKHKSEIDLNLERLKSQVENAEWIICFGKNAEYAIEEKLLKENRLNKNVKILKCLHLTMKNLNFQILKDIKGNELIKGSKGNTDKRIQVVAQELIDQYKQSK